MNTRDEYELHVHCRHSQDDAVSVPLPFPPERVRVWIQWKALSICQHRFHSRKRGQVPNARRFSPASAVGLWMPLISSSWSFVLRTWPRNLVSRSSPPHWLSPSPSSCGLSGHSYLDP